MRWSKVCCAERCAVLRSGGDRDFQHDLGSGLWLQTNWPDEAFGVSVQLAKAHIAHTGTRTLDTLHVAAALQLGAREFWTLDERQAKLAKTVGLRVV
jgi:hypothetical protein